jgi:cell division protein FtsB
MTTDTSEGAIMTPTHVDQLTEQTTSLAPPDTYPPPETPARQLRRPSSWKPSLQAWERRRWTAALASALLITAVGVGVLYADDTNNQATIRALQTQNESLTGRNQILIDQLKTTQTNLTATLGELATTKAQLEHPHLVLWNFPQPIKDASWYLAGGIPDTFTYHLEATSTGPMSVSILTLEDFAKALQCVDFGTGNTNYCMHHSGTPANSWLRVTSVNFDFHQAEGCADYVVVFTAATAVTVTPNVSVTYNPATTLTGACT